MQCYLVEWDNGQSYEDHQTATVCVAQSDLKALEIIEDIKAWIADAKKTRPSKPEKAFYVFGSDHKNWETEQKPPYGCDKLIPTPYGDEDQWEFSVREAEFVENLSIFSALGVPPSILGIEKTEGANSQSKAKPGPMGVVIRGGLVRDYYESGFNIGDRIEIANTPGPRSYNPVASAHLRLGQKGTVEAKPNPDTFPPDAVQVRMDDGGSGGLDAAILRKL